MKKITINRILFFIIGGIFFSSISVYATVNILSKNITFTPENTNWEVNNVEDAMNDLYSTANSKMPIQLVNDSNTTEVSNAILVPGNKYNSFKVTNMTQDDNVGNCYVRAWSNINSDYINLEINKEYLLNDQEYKLATIEVVSKSKNTTFSRCTINVDLYNK